MNMYTAIELGTNSIKVLVANKANKNNDKFDVIAIEEVKTIGMKKGSIINSKIVSQDLSECIKKIEKKLSTSIKKAILAIAPKDIIFNITDSEIDIDEEVSGDDISNLIKQSMEKSDKFDYELITSSPIGFKLDNNKVVDDPKGYNCSKLSSKIVNTYISRKELYNILDVFKICDISVIDIVFKPIADYFEIHNKSIDNELGVIINMGEDSTCISLHNKSIMIKCSTLDIGSVHIDHDISYIYKTNLKESRKLKENFALASTRYADKYDEIEAVNEEKKKIKINQYDITEVVEERLKEILKICKKEIKNLTNREISYIIILGGLSDTTGFQYLVDDILGKKAIVYNSTTIGMRHNKYTTVMGTVKYFDDKLVLRGKEYNMFDTYDIEKIINKDELENDAVIDEMFGQFNN